MAELEELFIEHEGVRMRTVAAGTGEPLVLLHGFGSSSDSWIFNLGELGQHFRVYAVDLPGFGQSTKVSLDSLDAFADWVQRLLDECGHDAVSVVGSSMGGAISLQFALRWPERVNRMILVDPLGLGGRGTTDFGPRMLSARTAEEVREMLLLVVHDPAVIIDAMIEGQLELRKDPQVFVVLKEVGLRIPDWQDAFQDRLDKLDTPILIVWGQEDRVLPVGNIHAAEGLPHIQTKVLSKCGHLPHVEMPGVFNELALNFLRSTP